MIFDVLTLFPEMINAVLNQSIIGRAQVKGIITINTINIRDFSRNKHRKVDDYPYGGGTGMVMMAQPIYDAYLSIVKNIDYKPHVIYMSPQGKVLTQDVVKSLTELNHIIILCGHYEGVDERVINKIVDEEISIGDYVLTGGELPAMVLIDSISRCIPGVLTSGESYAEESHYNGLLEHPQYTRPYDFMGMKVPDVLISGHHANINRWRRQQSLLRTYLKRADLLENLELNHEDLKLLKEVLEDKSD
ncbi:MAG: tRNA (guanosine(37)-N1)-methyltransferase TrmD [Clostridiaceae bacterium]|jgi:tRNA (guanine37-N1)-methyltransferase|nr:tRNA (guanosine(37)-N1)-methyltransferase TrmD [Clostridiaceae bacterium]